MMAIRKYKGRMIDARALPYADGGWSAHFSIANEDLTLIDLFQVDKTFDSEQGALETGIRSAVLQIDSGNVPHQHTE
jgi:hypothetical protein